MEALRNTVRVKLKGVAELCRRRIVAAMLPDVHVSCDGHVPTEIVILRDRGIKGRIGISVWINNVRKTVLCYRNNISKWLHWRS